jgi:hypothetical protein
VNDDEQHRQEGGHEARLSVCTATVVTMSNAGKEVGPKTRLLVCTLSLFTLDASN